jgi:hypothetical protein
VDRLAGRTPAAGKQGIACPEIGELRVDLPQAIAARKDLDVDAAAMLKRSRGRG